MGYNFHSFDGDRMCRMPPSLSDWLEKDHLAWFVTDAVGQIANVQNKILINVLTVKFGYLGNCSLHSVNGDVAAAAGGGGKLSVTSPYHLTDFSGI